MAKRFKKLLAVLLGASLLAGSMPVTANAANAETQAVESAAVVQSADEAVAAEAFAGEEAEEPEITLDGNGGRLEEKSWSETYTVKLDDSYETLQDVLDDIGHFRRDSYNLKGWATEADSSNPMLSREIQLTGTATYYAIWEKMPEIILNEKTVVPYDEKSGGNVWYFFQPEEDGWYVFDFGYEGVANSYASVYTGTTIGDNEPLFELGPEVVKDPVVKLDGGDIYGIYFNVGYWEGEEQAATLLITQLTNFVTLDGNGGELGGETTVGVGFEDGDTLSDVVERAGRIEREGYIYGGYWSTSPDGEDIQLTYDIVLEPGKTYYVVWGREISLTVNGNGGKTYQKDKATAKIDAIEGFPLHRYKDAGYGLFRPPVGKTYGGWALTPDAKEEDRTAIVREGMTVYAVWISTYCQVDLSANGGYFSTKTETWFEAGGYAGDKLNILPSDTPTSFTKGKVFDGWYYDADCTVPLGMSLSEFRPTGYTVLYAGYKDDGTMVSNITMSKTAKVLIGKTKTLKATVAPKTAKNKTLAWSSSNKKIATVSADGVVKGIAKGTVTITAKARDGSGVKATCKLTVCQPVTKITLSKTKFAVLKGKTKKLTATATPETAYLRTVTWSSSNEKVATVTAKGVVKGVGVGTAIITAKAKDGSGVKASCKVVVRQPVTRIAISKTQVSIKKGKSTTLKAVAKPTSAYNREVTWTSSNKKVATVTQKGVVKGVGKGTAIITVKAKDGSGTTVTCKVVVK